MNLHTKLSASALFIFSLVRLLPGCSGPGPDVIHDLSDASFPVVNQDSASVNFPADFKGDVLVVGFMYTHCPDICPIITAKMSNISKKMPEAADLQFVVITFDPKRDTPSVLNRYMKSFDLDPDRFTMLTGDSATIDTLLGSMDIKAKVSHTKTTDEGKKHYVMNHTNRILIMDKKGRVRFEYPGSAASEKIVIEDINRLRR